jgi:peptidoglycan L-alanyl-D-glutamate endopeptidase CwlK
VPAPVTITETTDDTRKTYGWKFGSRSRKELATCHGDLQKLMATALLYSSVDFGVTEGWRTMDDQRRYVAEGKSWTLESAHTFDPSLAVDIIAYSADGHGTWDAEHYTIVANAVERAAIELGVPYIWGGSWKSRDLVHFELDRKTYKDAIRPDLVLA